MKLGHGAVDAAPGAGAVLADRLVVRLLPILAAAAGCLDAVCMTRLGGPFASVITGNLVQLGRGIGTLDSRLAAAAGAAVVGYAVGVAAGTAGLRHSEPGWRRRTSLILTGELLLLACVDGGWVATGGQPHGAVAFALLAMAAAAMGVQSAVTLSCGVPDASTTYLTGTLTSLIRALVQQPRRYGSCLAGAGRLAALLGGATVAALTLRVAPVWTPAVSVALVGSVLAIVTRLTRSRDQPPGS